MNAFLWHFLSGPQALKPLLCLVFYWTLSVAIGGLFRQSALEALAFGFLLLASIANLVLFGSRALGVPTAAFGPLVITAAVLVAWMLQRRLFPGERLALAHPRSVNAWLAFLVCAGLIWLTQMLTPDPMAGMTAHQSWFALYLDGSFERNRFLDVQDLAFHPGSLSSLLLNGDLMGLSALGRWSGLGSGHDAFLAAAIGGGGGAAMAILCRGLDRNPLLLWGFVFFFALHFKTDRNFSLWVGNNWGDVLMYLGGAICLSQLTRVTEQRGSTLLATALAAALLVSSRSYGMFYGALICLICMLIHLRDQGIARAWKAWAVIAVIGTASSAREITLLLQQSSPYYNAGDWFGGSATPGQIFRQIFTTDRSKLGLAGDLLNLAYVPAAVLLALVWWRGQRLRRQLALAAAAPLIILAGPIILTMLTGYVSTPKLFVIQLFMLPWYPWRAAALLLPRPSSRQLAIGAVTAMAVVSVIALAAKDRLVRHPIITDGLAAWLSEALESYRRHNVDLLMARVLNKQSGEVQDFIRHRRILYLHDEPGLGLRYFLAATCSPTWTSGPKKASRRWKPAAPCNR